MWGGVWMGGDGEVVGDWMVGGWGQSIGDW